MYTQPQPDDPMTQGDIVDSCPLLFWDEASSGEPPQSRVFLGKVVLLTQACDLAQAKSTRVVVALVHDAHILVNAGILTPRVIQEQVRLHRVYGWYFLPAASFIGESIVDLRDLHTLPRSLLEELIRQGKRQCRIESPYREHLAQHFAITYSRIGLPSPYVTTAG